MNASDVVGIHSEIGPKFKVTLKGVFGGLGYPTEDFASSAQWLRTHTGVAALVAVGSRPSDDLLSALETLSESEHSIIVGVTTVTPGPDTFRQYLKAGVGGVIATDQAPLELRHTLAATMTGLTVIPPGIAQTLATRLEEPPPQVILTERDTRILRLIAQGATLKQIAEVSGCSDRHLRRIIAGLLRSIGATNRAHAAALATRWGID